MQVGKHFVDRVVLEHGADHVGPATGSLLEALNRRCNHHVVRLQEAELKKKRKTTSRHQANENDKAKEAGEGAGKRSEKKEVKQRTT